jgi:hypothetical protein
VSQDGLPEQVSQDGLPVRESQDALPVRKSQGALPEQVSLDARPLRRGSPRLVLYSYQRWHRYQQRCSLLWRRVHEGPEQRP